RQAPLQLPVGLIGRRRWAALDRFVRPAVVLLPLLRGLPKRLQSTDQIAVPVYPSAALRLPETSARLGGRSGRVEVATPRIRSGAMFVAMPEGSIHFPRKKRK